jgi:hypothetical protein
MLVIGVVHIHTFHLSHSQMASLFLEIKPKTEVSGAPEMRYVFTDGANSFWHVFFGSLCLFFPWIFLIFFAYQVIKMDENSLIDVLECGCGYTGTSFCLLAAAALIQ